MCLCISVVVGLILIPSLYASINPADTIDREVPRFYQTCISAPLSDGCESCKEFGTEVLRKDEPESVKDLCSYYEYQYNLVAEGDSDFEELDERCQDNLK